MRTLSFIKFSKLLFLGISIILPLIGTTQAPRQDEHLQSIVNLNEVLDHDTPSQFASQTMHNAIQKNATVSIPEDPVSISQQEALFQGSLQSYIKSMYNKRGYAIGLSQDASHLIHFLSLAKDLNIPAMTYVCLRLFYNKIKACELIDDSVINNLLKATPALMEDYFILPQAAPKHDLSFIKKHTENILLMRFTDHLTAPQTTHDLFISNLTEELSTYYQKEVEHVHKEAQDAAARERLRAMLIRFYELSLNKCIWNPTDAPGIWSSFKSIAQGFELCAHQGIIDQMDDLDDLYWSLVHRFCFFIDLYGAALPLSFYEEVGKDLEERTVLCLEFKEQDEGIITKKETLIESLTLGRTRAFAYERNGILSMPIPKTAAAA